MEKCKKLTYAQRKYIEKFNKLNKTKLDTYDLRLVKFKESATLVEMELFDIKADDYISIKVPKD